MNNPYYLKLDWHVHDGIEHTDPSGISLKNDTSSVNRDALSQAQHPSTTLPYDTIYVSTAVDFYVFKIYVTPLTSHSRGLSTGVKLNSMSDLTRLSRE